VAGGSGWGEEGSLEGRATGCTGLDSSQVLIWGTNFSKPYHNRYHFNHGCGWQKTSLCEISFKKFGRYLTLRYLFHSYQVFLDKVKNKVSNKKYDIVLNDLEIQP